MQVLFPKKKKPIPGKTCVREKGASVYCGRKEKSPQHLAANREMQKTSKKS